MKKIPILAVLITLALSGPAHAGPGNLVINPGGGSSAPSEFNAVIQTEVAGFPTGDGSTKTFSFTLPEYPVDPCSEVFHYTIGGTNYATTGCSASSGTDTVTGTDLSATVVETTGATILTFAVALDSGKQLSGDFGASGYDSWYGTTVCKFTGPNQMCDVFSFSTGRGASIKFTSTGAAYIDYVKMCGGFYGISRDVHILPPNASNTSSGWGPYPSDGNVGFGYFFKSSVAGVPGSNANCMVSSFSTDGTYFFINGYSPGRIDSPSFVGGSYYGTVSNTCAGSVTLSSGTGSVTGSCISASRPEVCTDNTSTSGASCSATVSGTTITLHGTGSDVVSWVQE